MNDGTDDVRRWLVTTPLTDGWQRSPALLSYLDMPIRAWLDFYEMGDRVTAQYDGDGKRA